MFSRVSAVTVGLVLGTALGVWIIVSTIVAPLAEDTPLGTLGPLGVIVFLFGYAGFSARRRGGRFIDAVKAGATAGAITFALVHLAALVRVNLFLDTIRYRGDWQNLVADFRQSGFQSLRAYANYVYVQQFLLIPAIGTIAGTIGGALGGLAAGGDAERRGTEDAEKTVNNGATGKRRIEGVRPWR